MERELARAKISANRVASVVANDWKDESDKVMPVKQWLEERRFLQVPTPSSPSIGPFGFFLSSHWLFERQYGPSGYVLQ